MCHEQLRIVSNGNKFRVQAGKLNSYTRRTVTLDDFSTAKSFWRGERLIWRYNPEEFNKIREIVWSVLNKNGDTNIIYNEYTDYYGNIVQANPPIEFTSKNAAIKWIKNTFGQEGLNKLIKPEDKWEVV